MISKEESMIIASLMSGPTIDEYKYTNEIAQLLKDALIEHNITHSDSSHIYYHGFTVTQKGKRAFEEYENAQLSEKRESEALTLAKEANNIAKESNDLSRESNKKSDKSNRIALGSLITAIISIIVAVVAIVVSVA